jgi:dUTP pyrophosphatase
MISKMDPTTVQLPLHPSPPTRQEEHKSRHRLMGYNKGKMDNTGVTVLKEQLFRETKIGKEKLQIKKLYQEARCPTQGSDEAAGWDLYSIEEKEIPSGGYFLVSIGISIAIPQGTYTWIVPRSGLVVKNMIEIGAGVINTDYRGEVKVLLFNHRKQPFPIKDSNQITQMILEKYKKIEIDEVKISQRLTKEKKDLEAAELEA